MGIGEVSERVATKLFKAVASSTTLKVLSCTIGRIGRGCKVDGVSIRMFAKAIASVETRCCVSAISFQNLRGVPDDAAITLLNALCKWQHIESIGIGNSN